MIAQTRKEKAQDLQSLNWRSKSLPLKNAKLATAILAAQETASQLASTHESTESKQELFDKVLQAYSEADKQVKKALKEDAVSIFLIIP